MRQQPAGRDQQVREHQQQQQKKVGECTMLTEKVAAKRPAAGKLMEVVGGEGSRLRAAQRIN